MPRARARARAETLLLFFDKNVARVPRSSRSGTEGTEKEAKRAGRNAGEIFNFYIWPRETNFFTAFKNAK